MRIVKQRVVDQQRLPVFVQRAQGGLTHALHTHAWEDLGSGRPEEGYATLVQDEEVQPPFLAIARFRRPHGTAVDIGSGLAGWFQVRQQALPDVAALNALRPVRRLARYVSMHGS